jgi:hypothetical protein
MKRNDTRREQAGLSHKGKMLLKNSALKTILALF